MTNVALKEGFAQVCVWPGTVLGDASPDDVVNFMAAEFNTRIQFLEVILTAPDVKNGRVVQDTGGRSDMFFAVHKDDISHFAVPRLRAGIRWLEDMYSNGNGNLYPSRCVQYRISRRI